MPEPKISDGGETVTCSDGTWFSVDSEHTRGEDRFYFVLRRVAGSLHGDRLMKEGTFYKRTAQRRTLRLAQEWENELPARFERSASSGAPTP